MYNCYPYRERFEPVQHVDWRNCPQVASAHESVEAYSRRTGVARRVALLVRREFSAPAGTHDWASRRAFEAGVRWDACQEECGESLSRRALLHLRKRMHRDVSEMLGRGLTLEITAPANPDRRIHLGVDASEIVDEIFRWDELEVRAYETSSERRPDVCVALFRSRIASYHWCQQTIGWRVDSILLPNTITPQIGQSYRWGRSAIKVVGRSHEVVIDDDHPSCCGSHLLGHEGQSGTYWKISGLDASPDGLPNILSRYADPYLGAVHDSEERAMAPGGV